jgi:hypothetical protein
MANTYTDEDNDFEQNDDKPRGLRAQLEAVLAEKKQLEDELNGVRATARQQAIKEVLNAKGVNDKVAKFIPADAVTEDAIVAWLEENADAFGVSAAATGTPNTAVSPANAAAANRLSALSQSGSSPSLVQDYETQIRSASSPDELKKIWADLGKATK